MDYSSLLVFGSNLGLVIVYLFYGLWFAKSGYLPSPWKLLFKRKEKKPIDHIGEPPIQY
jgi:hypothetical protein